MATWMLYGSNGYTGELIGREARRRGMQPILAGRNGATVAKLGAELGCLTRTFGLENVDHVVQQLAGVRLLLNCAGPFSATASTLIEACLRTGIHYLDITGEIDVIEAAAARGEEAKQAGAILIPAVGFDVVPTDCLAAMLSARLPTATDLQLAFAGSGTMSGGSAKTAIAGLAKGGRVRVEGRIVKVPFAWKSREVPFATGTKTAVTIPWGDVASAYYSTGIGNIEVYAVVSREQLRLIRQWKWLLPLLRWGPVQRFVQGQLARTNRGPTPCQRGASRASLWGRVEDAAGQAVEATLTTPNEYALTVLTALASIERVLAGGIAAGFHTPSRAFGHEFVLTVPSTEFRIGVDGS